MCSPGHGQGQGPVLALIVRARALWPSAPRVCRSVGPEVGGGVEAETQLRTPEILGQAGHPGIIGIINQDRAVRSRALDELPLGPGHPGDIPHALGVGRVDVGEHPDGGAAIRVRRLISPKGFMPISTTAASWVPSNSRSVRGMPMRLFRFSRFFRTRKSRSQVRRSSPWWWSCRNCR